MDPNLKATTASSNLEVLSERQEALQEPEPTVAPSCTNVKKLCRKCDKKSGAA